MMLAASSSTRRTLASITLGRCIAALSLASLLVATGCETPTKYQAIKDDPAPDLLTLNERYEDADNAWTITRNENWRMFWQDLGRVGLTDRPSRLTRETIPRP
jgi:hypothetical protein